MCTKWVLILKYKTKTAILDLGFKTTTDDWWLTMPKLTSLYMAKAN